MNQNHVAKVRRAKARRKALRKHVFGVDLRNPASFLDEDDQKNLADCLDALERSGRAAAAKIAGRPVC